MIGFFEEFPTRENLEKLKLVDFRTKLYIAACNLKEFYDIKNDVERSSPTTEVGYWPILLKEEGYWLSPFCKSEALQRVVDELKRNKKQLTVMWDAELPFTRPHLFITQLPGFFRKRRLIREFIKNSSKYNIKIVVAEYAAPRHIAETLLRFFGVKFSLREYGHKKIIMFYTSMIKHKVLKKPTILYLKREKKRYGNRVSVGLGTIARGILGDEPILSPQHLDRDLKLMERIGIREVIIFRLGGLTNEYIDVLKKYAD